MPKNHEKEFDSQSYGAAICQRAVSDHNLQASCVQTSTNDLFKVFRLNLERENVESLQFLTSSEENIAENVSSKFTGEHYYISLYLKFFVGA